MKLIPFVLLLACAAAYPIANTKRHVAELATGTPATDMPLSTTKRDTTSLSFVDFSPRVDSSLDRNPISGAANGFLDVFKMPFNWAASSGKSFIKTPMDMLQTGMKLASRAPAFAPFPNLPPDIIKSGGAVAPQASANRILPRNKEPKTEGIVPQAFDLAGNVVGK
ncbi:hypothetical protein TWF694_006451 [Orbilia ellipsospora]|uniref:Uncharacterized protein n=1 Tax=Orbilia ellipsospora TaxID=2528407 RepID=A0AAV9XK36_9PEZI